MMDILILSSVLLCLVTSIQGDTPANCTYDDIQGKWKFLFTSLNHDKSIDCSRPGPFASSLSVTLHYPDLAEDQYGNLGFWTIIYNQGFEVVINNKKHFAFSNYTQKDQNVTSHCGQTLPGWSHDSNGEQWGCFVGEKVTTVPAKYHFLPQIPNEIYHRKVTFINNIEFIDGINAAQISWKASAYKQFEGQPIEDMIRMVGGEKSYIAQRPHSTPVTYAHAKLAMNLPDDFDWRKVDGVNFVSPVRNQESCGSCYSFASLGMNEARIRIMTNNTHTPVFAPQDIVECSEYSQGCSGGFSYLVGGKYAEDFGLVDETCNPYTGKDGKCHTKKSCGRQYSTKYRYVGGYFGACNEPLMRQALVKSGPIAVGFEVYDDFLHYKSGIYHHAFDLPQSGFSPFRLTNHAVLVVGYGEENGEKFWTVKNSWSATWGEKGYFRIRRGNNECSIESMAAESFPIVL